MRRYAACGPSVSKTERQDQSITSGGSHPPLVRETQQDVRPGEEKS